MQHPCTVSRGPKMLKTPRAGQDWGVLPGGWGNGETLSGARKRAAFYGARMLHVCQARKGAGRTFPRVALITKRASSS